MTASTSREREPPSGARIVIGGPALGGGAKIGARLAVRAGGAVRHRAEPHVAASGAEIRKGVAWFDAHRTDLRRSLA